MGSPLRIHLTRMIGPGMPTWPRRKGGAPWCLTGLGRQRTASLLTLWLGLAQARSRLVLLAGLRGWPSITSFSELRKSLEPMLNMLEPTFAKEFKLPDELLYTSSE